MHICLSKLDKDKIFKWILSFLYFDISIQNFIPTQESTSSSSSGDASENSFGSLGDLVDVDEMSDNPPPQLYIWPMMMMFQWTGWIKHRNPVTRFGINFFW